MYNKSEMLVFPRIADISPPPYTQYPIKDNNTCVQEGETGIISHYPYPTLTPNLVASSLCVLCVFTGDLLISFYREKHNYIDEVSTAHFTADNTMALAENYPASSVGVEMNEHASTNGNGAQKKPKKK